MKLANKLVAFSIACAVLPLIVMSILTFDAARASLKETVEHELLSIAENELSAVQLTLSDAVQNHLPTWSGLGIMQDVLTDDFSGELERELVRLRSRYPQFIELHVSNEYGDLIATTDPTRMGGQIREETSFQRAIANELYQGDVRFSSWHQEHVIVLAAPIVASYDAGTVIGVLTGQLDWRFVQEQLARRKVFGAAQDESRKLLLLNESDGEILFAPADSGIPAAMNSSLAVVGRVDELVVDGYRRVVVGVRSELGNAVRNPGWLLYVIVGEEVVYSQITGLKRYLMYLVSLAAVLSAVLAYWFARSTVRPINRLLLGARQLAKGDYSPSLPSSRRDEIGALATAFAAMREAVLGNERELRRRTQVSEDAARLKGEFLANMSHEIRTPINGVLGMTELLLGTPLNDKQRRFASTIMRSGRSLLDVINDVLDFSKIEAGKLELQHMEFDLRELVEDVAEMLAENAHRKGVELLVEMPGQCPVRFSGDSSRLRQVLVNLVGNAIKFTERGEVRLCVSVGQPSKLAASRDPAGVSLKKQSDIKPGSKTVCFEVIDTGVGIPESAQNAIFESFVQADGSTTRKFGGTGLGLAISARLIDMMNGRIRVHSEPGEGSSFYFSIQLDPVDEHLPQQEYQASELNALRVLIVDDNARSRHQLQGCICSWGVAADMASYGPVALRELLGAVCAGASYDVAVIDRHMPGMDGLELVAAIGAEPLLDDLKIVLLNSLCDPADADAGNVSGVETILTKPVRNQELFDAMVGLYRYKAPQVSLEAVTTDSDTLPLRGHVLLAEDHPVNQEMMLEMLDILSFSAEVAENGQQAVDALSRGLFDLVLMDCQMPVMDGFEATQTIRQREASGELPSRSVVVALTANAMEGDRERCLASGMDEYLSKPVSLNQLRDMFDQWLPVAADVGQEDGGTALEVPASTSNHSTVDDVDQMQTNTAVLSPGSKAA